MIQDVYVMGATGRVGSEVVRQIFEKGDTDPTRHTNPTRIVGLASSTHTLYISQGISPEQAFNFTKKDYKGAETYGKYGELLEKARYGLRNDESQLVFVDVTALNEPMTQFHLQIIGQTPYGIVTANKNPIALSDYNTFQTLTQDVGRYGYRCSVMAGADVVPFVRDAKDLQDTILKIEGSFSGTLGYVSSELEKGRLLSGVVREAFDEGYTEPHPRDDLNGLDVARKLVVIARSAGLTIGIGDINVKPFVDESYFNENDVELFLDSLKGSDEIFSKRMADAKRNNFTLRYVATIDYSGDTPRLEVSLREVPKTSPLGGLEGTMNKMVITTEAYPNGYVIEAPGAGLEVTARNIRRDLLELLPQRKNSHLI